MRELETEFGILQFEDDAIIHFKEGIYGFESIHEYILINHDENGVIMTLQPIDFQVPQFIVLDPSAIIKEYNPIVPKRDKNNLNIVDDNDIRILVIAVVKDNFIDTVVNLKSPIVINSCNNQAYQIILEDEQYSIKYKIFDDSSMKLAQPQ